MAMEAMTALIMKIIVGVAALIKKKTIILALVGMMVMAMMIVRRTIVIKVRSSRKLQPLHL